MALLTDTSIRRLLSTDKEEWIQKEEINKEKLLIANFWDDSLTPVGYDLRVGCRYIKMRSKISYHEDNLKENEKLTIQPNEIVAIETEEYIGMPQSKQYSGIVVSKVSMGEEGLSHVSTSLDADYKGELIITMANRSKRRIALERKQPFCTVIFFKNEFAATKACEKDPNKHYMTLVRKWGALGKKPRIVTCSRILRLFGPFTPLIWPLFKYLTAEPLSIAEVALFAAISSMLLAISLNIEKIRSWE